MSKLSMSLDPQLLLQVRITAQRDGTTVHAIVRELLARYAASRMHAPELELCQPERASRVLGTTPGSWQTGAAALAQAWPLDH